MFTNGSTVLYDVYLDPTEAHPITNASLTASIEAYIDAHGKASVPAHLPPSDAMAQGGKYNLSVCGPEGPQWPQSSGVWVPWRADDHDDPSPPSAPPFQ